MAVAAATLWTSPKAAETSDRLALGTHSAIRDWVSGMTREQRVDGLVDRTLSQVLLGDEVHVEEIEDGWAKVIVPGQPSSEDARGYPGWIPTRQLTTTAPVRPGRPHLVSATATAVRDEPDGEVLIPGVTLGTRLTVIDEESYRGWSRVVLPGPQPPGWVRVRDITEAPNEPVGSAAGRLDAVNVAGQLLDTPYVWGGLTAYGVDCSGLVYLAYRMLGIQLPRDAHDQADATTAIAPEDARPGDLYFFARRGKRIHHIGVATEPGPSGKPAMIHAAGNYGKVVAEEFTEERAETFVGAHRVFAD
ncbi:C40 family peptidase [Stackebrandtia albiflava]|uniref:C40 family peptidase n=1 Tax=Stackebrandtia albiflava TaxID=406432 RepID=UPI0011BD6170|nr:C40 family peptidase [Stackebrandtia albiflava]